MPTVKIKDFTLGTDGWTHKKEEETCFSPEHNPPNMMVYEPGIWQHTCPLCNKSMTFTVYPKWC